MSKVITFSRVFPFYHPKAGQDTFFIEKILTYIYPNDDYYPVSCEKCGWMGMSCCCNGGDAIADTGDYTDPICPKCGSAHLDGDHPIKESYYRKKDGVWPKHHTVRMGRRWKEGDMFSPRAWSGDPYKSKQIHIAPDIKIEKLWNIEIWRDSIGLHIGKPIGEKHWAMISCGELAGNDGLGVHDFIDWFKVKPGIYHEAQIICWNNNIDY